MSRWWQWLTRLGEARCLHDGRSRSREGDWSLFSLAVTYSLLLSVCFFLLLFFFCFCFFGILSPPFFDHFSLRSPSHHMAWRCLYRGERWSMCWFFLLCQFRIPSQISSKLLFLISPSVSILIRFPLFFRFAEKITAKSICDCDCPNHALTVRTIRIQLMVSFLLLPYCREGV